MKFSKITTSLALCTLLLLVAGPSATVHAQLTGDSPIDVPPKEPTPHTPTKAAATTTAAITTETHTTLPSSAAPTHQATTSAAPPPASSKTTAAPTSVAPVVAPPVLPTSAPTGGSTLPPQGGTLQNCTSTDTCGTGGLCAINNPNTTQMMCVAMPSTICVSSPLKTCSTNLDCDGTPYTYCGPYNGVMSCAGLGLYGSCNPNPAKSNLSNVIKIAGIAVGSVAALAVVFAMVRWQRRRQRSKMPAEMFGEIDYGMTDRHSGAPSAKAAPLSEPYPFSSRPHAHGSDRPMGGGGGGYDNQYHEEPVGYNGHPKDQYYGHDNGGSYGYDQHSAHGGHGDGGFYDNNQYDDYNQHPQSHHLSPPVAPARAASPRHYDNYGAEPTELDFGGHGGHGGGGYGGRY
ncbi:hypothetical protein EMPS_10179 [Entomortierella parvispora]|uniref:Uncharacterized protein n=1 Tax=Entomortierella parvispora TaxID=205924 RepID=A0A9P3HJF6_9FUNG|nr:hypothetical protein EMPS_10179 [Entomortierella parvispora]